MAIRDRLAGALRSIRENAPDYLRGIFANTRGAFSDEETGFRWPGKGWIKERQWGKIALAALGCLAVGAVLGLLVAFPPAGIVLAGAGSLVAASFIGGGAALGAAFIPMAFRAAVGLVTDILKSPLSIYRVAKQRSLDKAEELANKIPIESGVKVNGLSVSDVTFDVTKRQDGKQDFKINNCDNLTQQDMYKIAQAISRYRDRYFADPKNAGESREILPDIEFAYSSSRVHDEQADSHKEMMRAAIELVKLDSKIAGIDAQITKKEAEKLTVDAKPAKKLSAQEAAAIIQRRKDIPGELVALKQQRADAVSEWQTKATQISLTSGGVSFGPPGAPSYAAPLTSAPAAMPGSSTPSSSLGPSSSGSANSPPPIPTSSSVARKRPPVPTRTPPPPPPSAAPFSFTASPSTPNAPKGDYSSMSSSQPFGPPPPATVGPPVFGSSAPPPGTPAGGHPPITSAYVLQQAASVKERGKEAVAEGVRKGAGAAATELARRGPGPEVDEQARRDAAAIQERNAQEDRDPPQPTKKAKRKRQL